jgi:hypothetical protein
LLWDQLAHRFTTWSVPVTLAYISIAVPKTVLSTQKAWSRNLLNEYIAQILDLSFLQLAADNSNLHGLRSQIVYFSQVLSFKF